MSNFQEIHCTYIYLNKHSLKQEMHNNNNKKTPPRNLGEEKASWYYTEQKSC